MVFVVVPVLPVSWSAVSSRVCGVVVAAVVVVMPRSLSIKPLRDHMKQNTASKTRMIMTAGIYVNSGQHEEKVSAIGMGETYPNLRRYTAIRVIRLV